MPATQKPLPYVTNAVEPYIDSLTMEIHHGSHYKAYVDNYNTALERAPQLAA
jgi:Fe-Mn family superoxide dismutase